MIMSPNFVFRLILIIGVFIGLKLKNFVSLPILIVILFVSDSLDCHIPFFPSLNGSIHFPTHNLEYQVQDKICDWILYLVFLVLFRNLFDPFTQKLLFFFLFWRLIGVVGFSVTGQTSHIKIFSDFLNSTLIAYAIYQYFFLSRNWYYVLIIAGVIFKLIFEQIVHYRTNY